MTTKIYAFWGTTILFCAAMGASAYGYLTSSAMADGFVHLGFPSYFRVELAVAKFIGIAALLRPSWRLSNEWAYAGFSITLVSAVIAHSCVGDPVSVRIMPVLMGVFLVSSYLLRGSLWRR